MISAIGSDVARWHPPPPSYETHGRTHSRVGLDSARWPQQGVLHLTKDPTGDERHVLTRDRQQRGSIGHNEWAFAERGGLCFSLEWPGAPERFGGQSLHVTLRHVDRPPAGYAVGALVFFHGYSGDPTDFVAFLNEIDPERRFHGYLPRVPHPGRVVARPGSIAAAQTRQRNSSPR
jgi:hypothetical protein